MFSSCVRLLIAVCVVVCSINAADYEYDYGDTEISYDQKLHGEEDAELIQDMILPLKSSDVSGAPLSLPLCCPVGQAFSDNLCAVPPRGVSSLPFLSGSYGLPLNYVDGFPTCKRGKPIQLYQKDVHFNKNSGAAYLPIYIHADGVPQDKFCITKIVEEGNPICEEYQSQIFVCLDEKDDNKGILWFAITIAHILIFSTLLAYFFIGELRCMQGQYMICFLISLLIYNLCRFPGSEISLDIGDVACIALGAVKYFFFCGIFLWYNVITFDIWRTIRTKQDISGRRRFLIYSAYSWIISAVLTLIILVLPYVNNDVRNNSKDDPLRDTNFNTCKLRPEMNMILQIAQFFATFLNLVFMILASVSICGYSKFGNGLPRCEASLCFRQGWKLFVIMLAHIVSSVDGDIVSLPVSPWQYLLLESAAIFGVFAYRKTVLRRVFGLVCRSSCISQADNGNPQEKGQLTLS